METEDDPELQLALALSIQDCPDSAALSGTTKNEKGSLRQQNDTGPSRGDFAKHESGTRGAKGRRSTRAIAEYQPTEEEIRQSFKELLSTDRAKITPANILTMAKKLGLDMDTEDAYALFEYAVEHDLISSQNSSKEISMDDFIRIAHHFKPNSS